MAALLLASTGAVGIGVAVAAAGFQNASVEAAAGLTAVLGQSNRLAERAACRAPHRRIVFSVTQAFSTGRIGPDYYLSSSSRSGGRWAAGSMAHTSRFCVCSQGFWERLDGRNKNERRSAWVSGLMPSSIAGPARRRHGDDGRGQFRRPARPACRRASPHAHTNHPG